jgi:hypothetical protein
MERIFANIAGAPFVLYWMMFPFCLVVSLFRLIAMRTSKIPQWPKEVDASCAIDPDDPYAIEGDANGDRVAVFPEAARDAGVGFCAPARKPSDMKKQAGASSRGRNDIGKSASLRAGNKKRRK